MPTRAGGAAGGPARPRDLHAPPEVLGRPVEIDFAPEARVAEMRPRHCDPRRDMTPDEAAAVIAWLMRMTLAAKAAIGVA